MHTLTPLIAAAGYTEFSGVLSTVFPLVVLIALLVGYVVVARRHP